MILSFTAKPCGKILSHRSSRYTRPGLSAHKRTFHTLIRASSTSNEEKTQKDKILQSLKASGMDKESAQQILKNWQVAVGHDVSPEDLRKILVGQSTQAIVFVIISTLFDAGASYTAFEFGDFLGVAAAQYGTAAVVAQAVAYLVAGYYATGAVFDVFKLGTVILARINFDVNSAAFLEAIKGLAGTTGLATVDKAREAVNSVKILAALDTLADQIKEQKKLSMGSSGGKADMLSDLGAYLTLSKAQKNHGFEAEEFGLTDAEAAEIAVVFGRFDLNDDGVLNEDEFKKLCFQFCTELSSDEEIKAALTAIDTNKDGTISFNEFVRFWKKQFLTEAQA